MSEPEVVGIDVGGTTIKGVRQPGGMRAIVETPPPADILDAIAGVVGRLRTPATCAVGIAVPGLVDDGVVRYAANLGWRDVALRSEMERIAGLPVLVEHDVVTAALAEGEPDLLYVALGTGIAATLLVDGRPWRGARGWAGEIGHLPVRPGGEPCVCGQRGCLEVYASAAGIARRHQARTGIAATSAELVGRAAAQPEWTAAIDALADALTSAVLLADPAVVVLGGGLSLAGEWLAAPLRAAVASRLAWRPAPSMRLSRHGADGGVVGAVSAARTLVPA